MTREFHRKPASDECDVPSTSRNEADTWIFLLVTMIAFVVYLVVLLIRSIGHPVSEVSYVAPMAWTAGIGMAVGFGLAGLLHLAWPRGERAKDERDKEIEIVGQYVGSGFVTIGAITALVLSTLEAQHFWISNTLFFGFLLGGFLTAATRVAAYRGEYPEI